MLKTLRFLIAILVLLGGINLVYLTNSDSIKVDAFSLHRPIVSRPIIIRPSHPITFPGRSVSRPIKPPKPNISQPIT